MRSPRFLPPLVLTLALAPIAIADPQYDFVLVDSFNPGYGLRETYLWGLNDVGTACGIATMDNVPGYPAFVWTRATGKTRIPISYPTALNNAGLVVGNRDIYDLNTGTTISPPGLPNTYNGPFFGDVNDAGIAVGSISTCNCSNSNGTLQIPYVWDAVNGARSISVPGAKGLGRINSAGVALGWVGASSYADGFFIDLGTGAYTMLGDVFPADIGVAPTRANDINDHGEIVGTRQGLGSIYFYGYVYSPATGVTLLPFPGGVYQQAVKPFGVNDTGTIVGEIYINGSSRGFVRTPNSTIRDLNDSTLVANIPAGFTLMTARRVNSTGWIIGLGYGGGGMYKSFVLIPRNPPCVADVDNGTMTGTPDGGVTIDDLLYYLFIFDQGLIAADLDNGSGTGTPDGGVTIDDLLYYLVRFDLGC